MNRLPAGLNGEDLVLLLLLFWFAGEQKRENTEMLIGLGFLLYVGIRERNEKNRITAARESDICL